MVQSRANSHRARFTARKISTTVAGIKTASWTASSAITAAIPLSKLFRRMITLAVRQAIRRSRSAR